jgi:hypothetical protein
MTSRFLTFWSDVDFGAVSHYFLSSSHQIWLQSRRCSLLAVLAIMALKEAGGTKKWACKKRRGRALSQQHTRAPGWPRSRPASGHYHDHRALEGSDEMASREEFISCTHLGLIRVCLWENCKNGADEWWTHDEGQTVKKWELYWCQRTRSRDAATTKKLLQQVDKRLLSSHFILHHDEKGYWPFTYQVSKQLPSCFALATV